MTNTSSNVCTTTYVTTLPIVSTKLYISPQPFLDSGEPSRKRKKECSSSSSDHSYGSQSSKGLHSHSPADRSRLPSSSSRLAPHWSPRRNWPASLAQPASSVWLDSGNCSGWPVSLACPACPTSLNHTAHFHLPACPSLFCLLVPVDLLPAPLCWLDTACLLVLALVHYLSLSLFWLTLVFVHVLLIDSLFKERKDSIY